MRSVLCCAVAAAFLAGCATTGPAVGAELVGRPLTVQSADGRVSTVILNPDGTSSINDAGRVVAGRWNVRGPSVCFEYAGLPPECWTYAGPLRSGMTLPFTSNLGRTVRVTM